MTGRLFDIKHIVVCLALLVAFKYRAQEVAIDTSRQMKFELGLSIYNIQFSRPDYFFEKEIGVSENYFLNGFYGRMYKGNKAFRCSFNSFIRFIDFPHNEAVFNPFNSFFSSVGHWQGKVQKWRRFSMGGQIVFTKTQLAPYYFCDLAITAFREIGFHEVKRWAGSYSYMMKEPYINQGLQTGLANGLGLRLQLNSFLVMNFETQFTTYFQRINNRNKGVKEDKMGATIHPAQFTLALYL